jgi:hypothetical protein
MNEQTVYRVPGNSHSSRQASVELMYCQQTGDTAWKANAIRTLNWATYTVDHDGKNCYIRDDIWLTDGYGDYVRHYLRAMAACPELAPINKNKLLYASSTVTYVKYEPSSIIIRTFDNEGILQLRLTTQPNITISNGNKSVKFNWQELRYGGLLTVEYKNCNQIEISLK